MKTKTKNFNTSAKYYDFIYTKKNYKKETNFILKFFNKNIKQTKILDLGTGTGSHLVHLISKGYKVDGVEIDIQNKIIRMAFMKPIIVMCKVPHNMYVTYCVICM